MAQHTFAIGRSPEAAIRIPDTQRTVSMLHADVTITDDGRLYLTDRNSTNGTAVFRRGEWRSLRQDFVGPDERLRFGGHETTMAELLAMVAEKRVARVNRVQPPKVERPDSPPEVRRPRRNPETGEIIED